MKFRWKVVSTLELCCHFIVANSRLRKGKCKVYWSCIVAIMFVLSCVYHLRNMWATLYCLHGNIARSIDELCDAYKRSEVAGNLCDPLCGNQISLESCRSAHLEKELVFSAVYDNKRIIMKAFRSHSSKYDAFPMERIGNSGFPSKREFVELLAENIGVRFNIPSYALLPNGNDSENLATRLWSEDFSKIPENSRKAQTAMKSIWTLMQHEYIMFKQFASSNIFPTVIGTCGHFYALEYVEPFLNLIDVEWDLRAEFARKLMAMTEDLEVAFHEPLHLCDVKLEHFGIDSYGNVKILDADNVYFTSLLESILASSNCDLNSDCDVFHCRAQCNEKEGKCYQSVTNDNLQAVCEELFIGAPFATLLPFRHPNLLHSPPQEIQPHLKAALQQCENPSNSNDKSFRAKTTGNIRRKIFKLLTGDTSQ